MGNHESRARKAERERDRKTNREIMRAQMEFESQMDDLRSRIKEAKASETGVRREMDQFLAHGDEVGAKSRARSVAGIRRRVNRLEGTVRGVEKMMQGVEYTQARVQAAKNSQRMAMVSAVGADACLAYGDPMEQAHIIRATTVEMQGQAEFQKQAAQIIEDAIEAGDNDDDDELALDGEAAEILELAQAEAALEHLNGFHPVGLPPAAAAPQGPETTPPRRVATGGPAGRGPLPSDEGED